MSFLLALLLLAAPGGAVAKKPEWSPKDPKAALLARLTRQVDALEYRDAEALSAALLAREDLTLDERLDTQLARGRVLAIIADPTDAEPMFRFVLRARPTFDFPDDTPPRVLAVFRKVQVEERRNTEQLELLERNRRIAGISLRYRQPEKVEGGAPLPVELRLRDDSGAVEQVRMAWRARSNADFASLPLARRGDGVWTGALPPSETANTDGLTLDYFFETSDAKGVLTSDGTRLEPRHLLVLPGKVKVAPPVSRVGFGVSAGVTVASVLATGALWLVVGLKASAFSAPRTVDAMGFAQMQAEGKMLSSVAVGVSVGALVALVTTLVLAPLTDFEGPREVASPFLVP